MKDTFYFTHDYNARQDSKIKRVLAKHGLLGYGIFWAIIEDLYNNANALPTDYESIAYDLRTDKEIVKDIVNSFDLFVIEENNFGSTSVQRRLEERNEKSATARKSAIKRWEKMRAQSEVNANALQSQSEGNAIKEKKGKEIKENKTNIAFGVFWDLYEKKKGNRQKCEKKWLALKDEEREKIIQTLPDFKKSTPDIKFRPFPETYLNGKRWQDELNNAATPKKEYIAKQNNDW